MPPREARRDARPLSDESPVARPDRPRRARSPGGGCAAPSRGVGARRLGARRARHRPRHGRRRTPRRGPDPGAWSRCWPSVVVGAALLDTAGRTVWAAIVDRAEGRLRADLLSAALHQPLRALSEQAVGEVLDRVDDDTQEVGTLVRRQVWDALRTLFAVLPMWIVAGLTWWPAWLLFPVFGTVAVLVVPAAAAGDLHAQGRRRRSPGPTTPPPSRRASPGATTCAPASARPTSYDASAELSARVHAPLRPGARPRGADHPPGRDRCCTRCSPASRSPASRSSSPATSRSPRLVTLFLVTSTFVGQIDQLARSPARPAGRAGRGHPAAPAAGDRAGARRRRARCPTARSTSSCATSTSPTSEGAFALARSTCACRPGSTCALVGRTGSGKSTLASLVSRAVEPEPGTVLLGGVDVLDLDLQQLRAAVGVVTQRTEILAGTLAENIALFADLPRERVRGGRGRARPDRLGRRPPRRPRHPARAPAAPRCPPARQQLVAFARLLVRDVAVVVLDEATARMDPLTEALVVRAADRLLPGAPASSSPTGSPPPRAPTSVAVLDAGQIVQQGPRADARQRRRTLPRPARCQRRARDACRVGDEPAGRRSGRGRAGRRRTRRAEATAAARGRAGPGPGARHLARPAHPPRVGPAGGRLLRAWRRCSVPSGR